MSSLRQSPGPLLPALLAFPLSLLFATRIWCNDIWWHLASGRWMVEHGVVPTHDPFTFAGSGAPWRYVTVVADLLYYGTETVGGAAGLVALKVLVAFALLTLLGTALRAAESSIPVLAGAMLLVAILIQPRMSMGRPLALGGLALAGSLAVAFHVWQRRVPIAAFALVPLAALWSGLHASAVLAAPVAGALAVAWWLAGRERSCGWVLLGNLFLVAGILALLPSGRGAFQSAFDHSTAECMRGFIQEWGAVDWRRGNVWIPVVMTVGVIPWLVLDWRGHALHLCLALGGLVLPFLGGRLTTMGTLLLAPALAAGMTLALARLPQHGALAMAGLATVAGLGLALSPGVALDRSFGFGLNPGRYPLQSLQTLERLPSGRVLNDFGLGGYLVWEGYEGRVFMDGRTLVVFDESHCKDLLVPLYLAVDGPDRVANRFDIAYGLAEWNSSLYERLMRSMEWIPVHHDVRSSLFVRRSKLALLPPDVLAQPELRQLSDERWMATWYAEVVANPARLDRLTEALTWTARHSPYSPVLAHVLQFLDEEYPEAAGPVKERVVRVLEEVL